MPRIPTAIILLFAAGTAVAATEVEISDVPEAARETAAETAPGATFTKVSAETKDGRVVYAFVGRSSDGRDIEVEVREDGTLHEIDMEMATGDLPPAVLAAIDTKYPGFTPASAETSIRSGKFIYEIEGTTAAGEAVTLEIMEDGTIASSAEHAAS